MGTHQVVPVRQQHLCQPYTSGFGIGLFQEMREAGTDDRLETVYDLENTALQHLQERQERVMLLIEGLGEEDIQALTQEL